ncbi:hypothetical protein B0T24DRAFT_665702 [Lasiosphaeria ovina]|uniref:Uncharacterized protein n=1 Tax=Lasiosphaeria ovina TaxID=92902 RepID=A0AAE0KID8_9PEZI|nr:hypothetical protein B0T24DRAFT_665702 [Lasiosphaeria ovina]
MVAIQHVFADRLPVLAALAGGASSDPGGQLEDVWAWLVQHWDEFTLWASQRHVVIAFLAWVITFTVVCIIGLGLGFGPVGVGAGSAAAVFQSWAYGAWTPAGGIFATLTSMAMIGTLAPAIFIAAATAATLVTAIVWLAGAGRDDSLLALGFGG